MILTTMAAMGFRVSLKKGERSTQVQWIGVQFSLHSDVLLVTVPKKFIDTVLEDHSWMARDGEHQGTQDDMWQTIVVVGRLAQASLGGGSLLQGVTPKAGRHQIRC